MRTRRSVAAAAAAGEPATDETAAGETETTTPPTAVVSGGEPRSGTTAVRALPRVVVEGDILSEQIVLAAAMLVREERRRLVGRLQPDTFLEPRHRAIWAGLQKLEARRLDFELVAFERITGDSVDHSYVATLATHFASSVPTNIDFHVSQVQHDKARHTLVVGPVAELLEALRDPRETFERLSALARAVPEVFRGHAERTFLNDGPELARGVLAELRERAKGVRTYFYGVPGLDYFDPDVPPESRVSRFIPGPAPGKTTVITGSSSHGKSTTVLNIVNGLRRHGRKTLVCAWEMNARDSMELLATIELGLSRSRMASGRISAEEFVRLEETMHDINRSVKFMDMPFFRSNRQKISNDSNLDLFRGYIADSGCDVVVADLWKRMLVRSAPEDEEMALVQQQALNEEMQIHAILLNQQLMKGSESRVDARPTREGNKGSAAWTEVADTMLGVHYPYAANRKADPEKYEVHVLKQRKGRWPLAIEFDYDPEYGVLRGGRDIPVVGVEGSSNPIDTPTYGGGGGGSGKYGKKKK